MNTTQRTGIMQRWNIIQHELMPELRNEVGALTSKGFTMNKTFSSATLNSFDLAVDAQKQVISSIVLAQKDFSAKVIEASGKAVASVAPYLAGNTFAKDALEQINTAFVGAVSNKDVLKVQEDILAAYDKQVTVNRTFLKNAVDLVPAAA